MTKKILAVVVAAAVMLVSFACTFALAEDDANVTPTDVVVKATFEPNGVSGNAIVVEAIDGKVIAPECTFEYDAEILTFEGWNTATDGTGTDYAVGAEIAVEGDTTFYAKWKNSKSELVEYTVTYDANGGEGEVIDYFNPYPAGGIADACMNEFTREGYDFVGWNTAADGSGTSYAEYESFDVNADVVLYAIWESNGEEVPGEETKDDDTTDTEATEDVSDTDVEDDINNPKTGEAATIAISFAVAAVGLGAVVVLKKRA